MRGAMIIEEEEEGGAGTESLNPGHVKEEAIA